MALDIIVSRGVLAPGSVTRHVNDMLAGHLRDMDNLMLAVRGARLIVPLELVLESIPDVADHMDHLPDLWIGKTGNPQRPMSGK